MTALTPQARTKIRCVGYRVQESARELDEGFDVGGIARDAERHAHRSRVRQLQLVDVVLHGRRAELLAAAKDPEHLFQRRPEGLVLRGCQLPGALEAARIAEAADADRDVAVL